MSGDAKYVYFIRPVGMSGPIKIGFSEIPHERLRVLMSWSPFPLEVIAQVNGNYELEQNLHSIFAPQHTHREWFEASAELLSGIEKLRAGAPLTEAFDLTRRNGHIRNVARKINPIMRERHRYLMKIHWTQKRMKRLGLANWSAPEKVHQIMNNWGGYKRIPMQPTDEELQIVTRYLNAPEQFSELPSWEAKVASECSPFLPCPKPPAYAVGKPDATSRASGTPFTYTPTRNPRRCRRPTQHTKPRSGRAKSDGLTPIVGRFRVSGIYVTGCKSRRAVTFFTISSRAAAHSPAPFRMDHSDCRASGAPTRLRIGQPTSAAAKRIPMSAEEAPVAPAIQIPCVSSGLSSSNLSLSHGARVRPIHGPDNSRGERACPHQDSTDPYQNRALA
ncbi:GIY-YIG nuclease family protein [Phyllobacterium leguminum]|uniref:T5orf172 domain-containing protein n=1 Tax=Phyllobacterium leguminum TaxID=314237 RepID=A0A318T422_9HYPH|nr:T5orf172 domain-containing protein [Phyllobacterium leguminum]